MVPINGRLCESEDMTFKERFTEACSMQKFKPYELIQGPDAGEVQHVLTEAFWPLSYASDLKKTIRIAWIDQNDFGPVALIYQNGVSK